MLAVVAQARGGTPHQLTYTSVPGANRRLILGRGSLLMPEVSEERILPVDEMDGDPFSDAVGYVVSNSDLPL
jgi:hypothetical protein